MGIEAYLIMDVAAVPRRKNMRKGALFCPVGTVNPRIRSPREICKRNQIRRINYTHAFCSSHEICHCYRMGKMMENPRILSSQFLRSTTTITRL